MCVIAWAWQVHPRYPLMVLANRDERHARPALSAHWWTDAPEVLAGRDVEAGGTWLGITRTGRFAAVTNRPGAKPPDASSRGDLTADFLRGLASVEATADAIATRAEAYAGFNLLLGDRTTLVFVSNRETCRRLDPGVYGMANGALDEPLPKVERLVVALDGSSADGAEADVCRWLHLLEDDKPERGRDSTGAIFVRGAEYGTRASSLLLICADDRVRFVEHGFGPLGQRLGIVTFEFWIAA